MRVEKTTFHKSAHTFNILGDDGELIARVEDERLAYQFALSGRMRQVIELMDDAEDDPQLLGVLIDRAREIIEELER